MRQGKEKHKILIADPDRTMATLIKNIKGSERYHFEVAKDGFECLAKIEKFQPDLLLIELMLPKIHGIEILRKIKTDPRTKEMGVILMTAQALIQNYQAAVNQHCDYFLQKPFKETKIHALIADFFTSNLKPEPFSGFQSSVTEGKHCYLPKRHAADSYIKFWGTRGSNPVSGAEYVRFGGNTSCLEVRHHDDLIIVDAGTGIRPFGGILEEKKVKQVHLLIGHTHWDHLAGFPFFAPIYNADCQVTIWSPIGYEQTTKELFKEMLAHAYFPVRLDDIQARLIFKDIHENDPFSIGGITVDTHYANHPGATLCFKFQMGKKKFGYATDNEFLMGYHGNPNEITKTHPELHAYRSQVEFFKGCNFLIHEAQYTPMEYQTKVGWGHSSVSNAAILIRHAEIEEWIITHHDPKHTDMDLLNKIQLQFDILDDCQMAVRPRMAFDQLTIPL